MRFNRKYIRVTALFLLLEFSFSLFFPPIAWALTGGTSAPEFSTFTPVATTDMVNLFTGDFNYNLPIIEIPGAEGGGYALSLAYNSGNTSEQEATWVGFGWSLNPGAINRTVRGFPDDANGITIDIYNKTRPVWTTGAGVSAGMELFSNDIPKDRISLGGLSASSSLRFNNYQGYTKSMGFGITAKGFSLNMNMDNDGVTWSGNISPANVLAKSKEKSTKEAENSTISVVDKKNFGVGLTSPKGYAKSAVSTYKLSTFSESIHPTSFNKFNGISYNWSVSGQINPSQVPIGMQAGFQGFFNMQFNQYKNSLQSFGYMHSDKAGTNGVMDYYVEKGSSFDKRDYFIGMPFGNYDMYSLSGEGLSGGFRAFNAELGHYRPNADESSLKIRQLGIEFMVGANIGVGVDFGIGSQKTKIDDWNVVNKGNFGSSNNQIFRFNNDLGGTISYTDDTNLETGELDVVVNLPGAKVVRAVAPTSDGNTNFNIGSENGRSSYTEARHENSNTNNPINGFTVFNEDGLKYAYNNPVYVRNQTNLSIDIDNQDSKEWKYLAFRELKLGTDGTDGYEITDEDLNSQEFSTAVGEIRKEKYVNNYLLSSISTPDYVDLTGDGPSQDDFGGWTKFNYNKIYGIGEAEWYRHRAPYNGLLYQQNSISDTKDDVGSVITGEKEVQYLANIETNTHIAYFVTNKSTSGVDVLNGSGDERLDGLGAIPITSQDLASQKSSTSKPIQGTTQLEYLERIVLFSKDVQGNAVYDRPLKIVKFEYDYSLVPNVPNNVNSTYTFSDNAPNNLDDGTGKLTLKKVWFEYGGVIPAKISPYEFGYSYKHSSEVPGEFSNIFSAYDVLSDNDQNPVYSPSILSPWGYPMANGKVRKQNNIPWIDQSYYNLEDAKPFDPASWQLKAIKLPSGGEILIQYEEKDYTHVQDRNAMAMASLFRDGLELGYDQDPVYTINPEDLGANPLNIAAVQALVDKITDYFTSTNGNISKKIYFKFLYALKGDNPSLDDCRSDYISGYANFKSAELAVVDGKNVIQIKLRGEENGRSPIPRTACYEFVSNLKQGKLENSDCIDWEFEAVYETAAAQAADNSQIELSKDEIRKGIAIPSIKNMAYNGSIVSYQVDEKTVVCKEISPQHSFLKLPVLSSKKGGGVRVKKLLMYDTGIESGDEAVYGSEYLYVLEDGITSSGVATTEPSVAREENPLVTFMPKANQSWFNRITSGQDKEQTEGPLGESLLPAPTVGHSRIIIKNIHTGTTGTGYSVNKFYTVKDYPFDRYYGPVSTNDPSESFDVTGRSGEKTDLESNTKKDWLVLPLGLINFETSKVWTAQGFRFILNNMHGQVKKTSNFGGSYVSSADDGYLVSYKENEYYEPGEKVKMLKWDAINKTFEEYNDVPGKEMDIAMESKRLKDETIDFSIEIDISVGLNMPPPIFVGVGFSFDYADKIIATHATTKVLRYPSILKKVTSSQDGVTSTTENLAFSKATGQTILTKTTDSFHNLKLAGSDTPHNGSMYSLSIPAEWLYPNMGQKAANPANTNQLKAQTATFSVYGVEPNPAWFLNPTNLLSAGVQTFSNDWSSSWGNPKIDNLYNSTVHITALNQIWRPSSSWVYKSNQEVSSADKKIYESGYFDMSQMFDWEDEYNQPDNSWIKTAQITKYSPHGNALEETNALDIPSAALFGTQYGNHLPIMVAQNAQYDDIFFEDFENSGNEKEVSHSGSGAYTLVYEESIVDDLLVTDHLANKGGVFYTWLHFDTGEEEVGLEINLNTSTQSLDKVARTGEWTLYKAEITASEFAAIGIGNGIDIAISSANGSFSQSIEGDDIRFQPLDAEASCYVYDYTTFRLIAQYDSEHFGLYYQYNEEGQLTRKIIETERGIKTIQETQYNTQKTSRL